jgi:DNA-binding NtrC family response regulator
MNAKLNILIVEDSPDDAVLAIHELKRPGCELKCERVETEGGLRRALAREAWDVVLCDFTLPQFNGKQALDIVREADAELPFIYVSGTIGEDVAVAALKSGANDYVLKSNLKRLGPAVERELREARLRRDHRILEADRERLVVDLQAAMTNLKRLSGLLPICSACRSVRDDDDHWLPIEDFIRKHADAQFTHCLCPDCTARLREFPHGEDKPSDSSQTNRFKN